MKRVYLVILVLMSIMLLGADVVTEGIDLFALQESQITPELIDMIKLNNEKVDRSNPSWNFGTTTFPVPLPGMHEPLFMEDTTWSKDFTSNIVYTGSGQLTLFYNSPSQRFNITTDPLNRLKLIFTIKPEMANWYGTETIIIGVSDSPTREPSRDYATAVVKITVTPADDPIILNCPDEFTVLNSSGDIDHYEIDMVEETPLTINFMDYNGQMLIRTVDDLNNPSNYEFYITQTQPLPYDVVITQTPAYVGKTVTFTPRPGFFGEVSFAITNTDNNINGFLDLDPGSNTCLNVFVLKVGNVNDATVIKEWTPADQTLEIIQSETRNFSVCTFDEDDKYLGFVPPATEVHYEWRITGSEYGVPFNRIIAHTNSASPGNPLDVLSSVNYTFNYPGTFQLSVVVSDDDAILPPVVWNINVLPAGPEFTLPGGTYNHTVSVGLFSTVSPTAPIYYTLDGSLPDDTSSLFDAGNPIIIATDADNVTVTITAVYYDPIYGRSGVTSQTYVITGTVVTPVFNLQPLPYIYTNPQLLTITSATPGYSIRYTIDGTDPSETVGIHYAGPISIPIDTIISVKAIAYKDAWISSPIVSGSFRVSGEVRIDGDITFDKDIAPFAHVLPVGGTLSIAITNALLYPNDADTKLYFTTNNTAPTTSSTLYTGPGQLINITQSTIVRFRAFRDDWAPSTEKSYQFLINGQIIIDTYSNGTVFSPDPNTIYTSEISVTINGTTPAQNTGIYYTVSTDPNIEPPDPTPASTRYPDAGQIVVPELSSLRIKARAYHISLQQSPVYEALYTVNGKLQPPIFNPGGGQYPVPQVVTINTNPIGEEVRYTMSNDINVMPADPTQTDNRYTTALIVPLGTTVIKARVFKTDWTPSDVVTAIYYIGTLQAPTFSPVEELHHAPISVFINHSDPTVTIRYVEGTGSPTELSPIFNALSPIQVTQTKTYTAKAFKAGWSSSAAVTKTYTITGTLADLRFTPNLPGSYENSVLVGIHSDNPGVTIRFTIDGTEPTQTTNGQTYSVPFTVTSTTRIRARAYKTDWLPSDILDGLFEIESTVASPVFTPPPATYTSSQDVYILSYTAGARIRYTLDGTLPSSAVGTLYNPANPIRVEHDTLIRAIAYTGGLSSAIIDGQYYITGMVATPVFTPPPRDYASAQLVSISTATPGATIYYTTNGMEPNSGSNVFVPGTPIDVAVSTVIKAIATLRPDW
ncbi:MAG: chitobiase/beta-hexosaminidase C-terminal domain-containing protein, partial [Candidatus Cloacimonas sp.]|nr:chitobiase/beta-hexosaminidase C-terminal domain-containing protein [Candidatus Cloacimonas sp.]